MVSLCEQILTTTILLGVIRTAPIESEANWCISYKKERVIRRIDPADCLIEETDGQRFIFCTARFSVATPRADEDGPPIDDSDEDDEERRNLTLFMDYRFKMSLHDASESGVVCMQVISVDFEKLMTSGDEERGGMSMPSSVFSVVANTEMFMSKTEVLQRIFLGAMEVNPICWEKNTVNTSCIRNIIFTSNASEPGSDDDIHRGLLDYTIFGFGYSRISPISGGVIQTLYRETTRRGRVILQHLPGENITELRLPNNRWKSLHEKDLPENLPKVEIIDLSKNKFGEFKTEVIGKNGILKVVNISESQLIRLPPFIEKQQNLSSLDIGGNNFDYGDDGAKYLSEVYSHMTQMKFLNISGFATRIFYPDTLPNWPNLEILDASKCKIVSIKRGSFDNFIALEWLNLASNNLYTIDNTLFSKLKNLRYLDLSSNKLIGGLAFQFYRHKDWPQNGMQVLNLSKTSLGTISELLAEGSQVKTIDLSDNVLRDLNDLPGHWKGKWVLELNLSSNLIPSLSKDVGERLEDVQVINLDENKFDCSSCDMPYFKEWLNIARYKLTSLPDNFLCNHPVEALENNTNVLQALNYIDPCKGPNYPVLVSSSLSSIMLLACLLGSIFYIYRFEVSYIIHMIRVRSRAAKGDGKPHNECIYDAFVSYSGRDRTWVLRVLQPALEECDQKYQLCLHDRNFTLGGIITQNIVDSIDKSRKTLLILSENFVDSQWCRWEMEMANHKLFNDSRNFLVLIELERLDRKVLPRHLRFLMDTRTYLEWPTDSPPTKETLEMETNLMENVEYQGNSSEQDFWRRLHEALGDSLYLKEQKVKREAEIAMLKTKEREADESFSAEAQYQHH